MWNGIQYSQLRLGPLNWLDLRLGEKTRRRDTFLKATLVILFVSVNDLCVHVPRGILDVEWYSALAAPARPIELGSTLDEAQRSGSGMLF